MAKKAADSKARIKARETPESIARAERFKKLLKKEDAVRPLVEAMRSPKTNKEDLISEIAKKADLTIHQVKSILEENQLI